MFRLLRFDTGKAIQSAYEDQMVEDFIGFCWAVWATAPEPPRIRPIADLSPTNVAND